MYRCALFKGDFSKGCPVWQPKKLKWVICNVSLLNDLIVWVKNKTLTKKRWSEHHTILTTQNIKNECCLLSISRKKTTFLWVLLELGWLQSAPSGSGSVFAIICHMATVLWVQTEMCNGSVHFNSTVFHLCSPLAQFHYPQGIQGVMASRARNPDGHFKFFAQTFAVIVQELCVTVWIDERENTGKMYSKLQPSLLMPLCSFKLYIYSDFWIWKRSLLRTFEDLNTHLNRFISNWFDSWESK